MGECRCDCVFTHYVLEPPDRNGLHTSLCGKVWTPSKNPEIHKRCPECVEILESTEMGWRA